MAPLKNPQIQISILKKIKIGEIITLGEAPTLGLSFASIQLNIANQLRCLILLDQTSH
jgi:hypothetical protein